MNKKIAIIGFGHIGKALFQGLIASGLKKEHLFVSNSSQENRKVAVLADWIIIAVKPGMVEAVIGEIKDIISNKIVISVSSVVNFSSIEKYAQNNKQKIIRLMPNIPAAIGEGTIGFFANKNVSIKERSDVINIFSRLGKVIECQKETELDVMTLLSGCGPAIVAYFVSLLVQSGEEFGLKKNKSEKIALQTFAGTLIYLQKTNQTAKELQIAVATKGGMTEQIIKGFDEKEIASLFMKSLERGYEKIKQINDAINN